MTAVADNRQHRDAIRRRTLTLDVTFTVIGSVTANVIEER